MNCMHAQKGASEATRTHFRACKSSKFSEEGSPRPSHTVFIMAPTFRICPGSLQSQWPWVHCILSYKRRICISICKVSTQYVYGGLSHFYHSVQLKSCVLKVPIWCEYLLPKGQPILHEQFSESSQQCMNIARVTPPFGTKMQSQNEFHQFIVCQKPSLDKGCKTKPNRGGLHG